jgi:MraZ protein
MFFTGEQTQKIDGKGRLLIPSEYRRLFDAADKSRPEGSNSRFILSYGDHLKGHLRLYSLEGWDIAKAMVATVKPGTPQRNALNYTYLTQNTMMETDKEGRVVLPARHRQKIGLDEGEVSIQGSGDFLEIWNTATFEDKKGKSIRDFLATMPEGFDPISFATDAGGG